MSSKSFLWFVSDDTVFVEVDGYYGVSILAENDVFDLEFGLGLALVRAFRAMLFDRYYSEFKDVTGDFDNFGVVHDWEKLAAKYLVFVSENRGICKAKGKNFSRSLIEYAFVNANISWIKSLLEI